MRPAVMLFGPALAWLVAAAGGVAWTLADSSSWTTIDRHGSPVAGSSVCRDCHADAWQSWHASFHRTMTQRPSPGAELPLALATPSEPAIVLAPFAGETLDYAGFRATMDRRAGIPRVRVARLGESGELGERVLDVEVALTVGSHRYQQYVGAIEGELFRLPLAWHRGEARWIHMNGAFVEPEGEPGSLDDYQRHLSRWNDNCIFCHNTEPVPGLLPTQTFESAVGELGIACEACHGPAQAHVDRQRNPLRRMLAGRDLGDGSITQPARLDAGRESAICGRCHGQRIARDIASVMAHGDGFVPGDSLAAVSRPIFADSTIGTEALPFAMRFWPDGTPRLSAYEYQALLLSPCYAEGAGLGCNHCHDMHGDDPAGQLRAGRAGEGACVGCHELAPAHGGHRDVASVDCLDCHMPPITYGLLEGMVSHRITSPDPGLLVGRQDQPDACTQCHVDRSRRWAAESMASLGLRGSPPGDEDPLEREASRVLLDLHGGDPIQRNLAAHALAQADASGSIAQRMIWIAAALEDEYPSVRWFAWRGLRSLAEAEQADELVAALASFDYLGPIEARVAALDRIHASLDAALSEGQHADAQAEAEALFDELSEARARTAIWIGE